MTTTAQHRDDQGEQGEQGGHGGKYAGGDRLGGGLVVQGLGVSLTGRDLDGIDVVDAHRLEVGHGEHNHGYLMTKKVAMGHLLDTVEVTPERTITPEHPTTTEESDR